MIYFALGAFVAAMFLGGVYSALKGHSHSHTLKRFDAQNGTHTTSINR